MVAFGPWICSLPVSPVSDLWFPLGDGHVNCWCGRVALLLRVAAGCCMRKLTKHSVDCTTQDPRNKVTISRSPNGEDTIMQTNDQYPEQLHASEPTIGRTLRGTQRPSSPTKPSLQRPRTSLSPSSPLTEFNTYRVQNSSTCQ